VRVVEIVEIVEIVRDMEDMEGAVPGVLLALWGIQSMWSNQYCVSWGNMESVQ
jgi:hypothetical protein